MWLKLFSAEFLVAFFVIQMNVVVSGSRRAIHKNAQIEHNNEIVAISQTTLPSPEISPTPSQNVSKHLDILNSLQLAHWNSEKDDRMAGVEERLTRIESDIELIYEKIKRVLSANSTFSKFEQGYMSKQSNCGDVIVGTSGHVVFRSTLNHSSRTTCTWTIRANTWEKTTIKLISDNLDPQLSSLSVFPMWDMRIQNASSNTHFRSQIKLYPGDRNEHIFSSPVLFISLTSNASTLDPHYRPSFVLYFEGRGKQDMFSSTKFTHYHYTSAFGELVYPNGLKYDANEAVSWVINPPYSHHGNLQITMKEWDVDYDSLCRNDYVKMFFARTIYYTGYGLTQQDWRYCGKSTTQSSSKNLENVERWIGVFFSDSDTQKTGFKFSWDSD